jgi:aminopeptidase N
LEDDSLDPALIALMLTLPSENYLAEIAKQVDVEALFEARESVRHSIAVELRSELQKRYTALYSNESYEPSAEQIASRSLRNGCLAYLVLNDDKPSIELAVAQFVSADNMTDQYSALVTLVNSAAHKEKKEALAAFHSQWQHEPLVVNQWLSVQAACRQPGTIEQVKVLMADDDFDIKNPNKVRSLIGVFCNANAINFHRADGSGYELLTDVVLQLNSLNPQVASRMLGPLTRWKKYPRTAELMEQQLQRIMAEPNLSKDVYEVVAKTLQP